MSNPFEEFRKSVFNFCGTIAMESIQKYFKRGVTFTKVDFTEHKKMDLMRTVCRVKTASKYAPLKLSDLKILGSLGNYAKAGNIDALHAFLIVQNAEIPKGLYYIEEDKLYLVEPNLCDTVLKDIMQDGNRGDDLDISKIPALLIIVAEHDLKMVKYKDLGYEYCLLEAGMMLQNLYLAGGQNPLAIRPMGSYDKTKVLLGLGLWKSNFTPMITAIIGSNGK